jgi:hypothetical protein
VVDEPTCLFLQVRENLRIGSAGVARACVDVRMVGGKDTSHSFRLLLNERVAIIDRELVVFLSAIINIEVLDARVQQLQLGALVLEMWTATMPALDFAFTLRTARRAPSPWMKASPSPSGLRTCCNLGDNHLRIVVSSLRHVIRQVHHELEVSAVIGSAEQHA